MLEFFRQHLGGFFGIAIVGLLALAFALSFGAQSRGWGKAQTEQYAATVDGYEITEMAFRYAFNLSGGRNINEREGNRAGLQRAVLAGLVERQLLLDMAEEIGVSASTDEAEERIAKNEFYLTRPIDSLMSQIESNMFLSPAAISRVLVSDGHRVRQSFTGANGRFDLEGYQKFVRYYLQYSEEDFVEQQRLEIIAQRVRQIIAGSVRISEDEIRESYERDHDTAKIEYIRLIPSYFADKLDPSAAELEAWAAEHADEVKQYYETNKFRYTNLEKMARARHILIKADEGASQQERDQAETKIEGLLKRVKAGEDFGLLAKQYSEDEGSAAKGGDLGFNPRGRMLPEFDEAMFNAKPGGITDIVETKFGYHIIKVEEFREGNIAIEEATPEIAEFLYRRSKGEETAKKTGDDFLIKLKAGETMASLVLEDENKGRSHLSLKVLTSRPFTSTSTSIPGIGEDSDMVKSAFAASMENPIPDKVFEVRGDYYVIRLVERNKPNEEEFQKLKGGIAESMLSIKQGSWLRDEINEIRRKAENEGRIAMYLTSPAASSSRRQAQEEGTPAESEEEEASGKDEEGKPASKKPVKRAVERQAAVPSESPSEEDESEAE
jgi:peptidyl-prolyl cis-trans isomerase D